MGYREDFYKFAQKHKSALRFVLPINPDKLTNEDLRILCNYTTYRAGEGHFRANGNTIDPSMLDDVRVFFNKQPTRQDAFRHIHKAFHWYLKGCLNQPNVAKALKSIPKFSPALESFMRKNHKETFSKSLDDMSKDVLLLTKESIELRDLLKKNQSKIRDSIELQRDIRDRVKRIEKQVLKCNRQARMGIAWGIWEGVPAETAIKCMEGVYLNKVPKFEHSLQKCESFLKSVGIKVNVCSRLYRSDCEWKKTKSEILDTVSNESAIQTQKKGKTHGFEPAI